MKFSVLSVSAAILLSLGCGSSETQSPAPSTPEPAAVADDAAPGNSAEREPIGRPEAPRSRQSYSLDDGFRSIYEGITDACDDNVGRCQPSVDRGLREGSIVMAIQADSAINQHYTVPETTGPCYVWDPARLGGRRSGGAQSHSEPNLACDITLTRRAVPPAEPDGEAPDAARVRVHCATPEGATVLSDTGAALQGDPTSLAVDSAGIITATQMMRCWLHGASVLHLTEAPAPRRSRPSYYGY